MDKKKRQKHTQNISRSQVEEQVLSSSMPPEFERRRAYKNYTMLALLILLMIIMFGLTIIKMSLLK